MGAIKYAWAIGAIDAVTDEPMPDQLRGQIAVVAAALAPDLPSGVPELPPAVVFWVAVAWTQLCGMITFELFGQFVEALSILPTSSSTPRSQS